MTTVTEVGRGMQRLAHTGAKRDKLNTIGADMALAIAEVAQEGGAVADMYRVMTDALGATMYVRAPSATGRGHDYVSVPDHHTRLASVTLMAKILRITPEAGAGVQVNVGAGGAAGDDAINVTASERLSELEAAGGSREPIIAAVEGLLATLKGGQGAGKA